ncbi:class I SAM-dependent methyltransferase [Chloroflexota bacterium]
MSRQFFNSRAAIWDEEIAEKDTARLEAMIQCLDIEPGAGVLDVGTGTGVFVPFLLEKIGPEGKLVCLDFSDTMLDIARGKGFQGNIRYLCADIDNSGLPAKSFDAVVCYSVFPHFDNKPKILREINRILKPGGGLFVCHTSSRNIINDIHRQLPEVCDHLLPENDAMHELMSNADFVHITISDGDESYLASARKPATE